MADIDVLLGIVGWVADGEYDPGKEYSKGKLVSFDGGSYLYKYPTPSTGTPLTTASHWQQIASMGGQDLVDAAVAARDAAAASAAQLAAGLLRPKGTYANLAALNAGTPTAADTNEIYITLDDGKWCYHNGSAWVAGGAFQAASVATDIANITTALDAEVRKSVYITSRNILDVSQLVDGKYLAYDTGAESNNASFSYTGNYMPVDESTVYTTTNLNGNQICFYDIFKKYISGASISGETFTTPTAAAYYRISFYTNTATFIMIEKGTTRTPYEPYAAYGFYGTAIETMYDELDARVTYTALGNNLIDKDSVVTGKLVNQASGGIGSNAGFCYTKYYMPMEAETDYTLNVDNGTFSGGEQICFYDSAKAYLSGAVIDSAGTATFTTPASTAYFRVSLALVNIDKYMLAKGTVAMAYEPFIGGHIPTNVVSLLSGLVGTKEIIVAADGSGQYTTLTAAVAAAPSGAVIRVMNGVYDNEMVSAFGKHIHIIGQDRNKAIIKNGLSTYSTPPIEASHGMIENLTIYAEYVSGVESTDGNGWNAYGLHVDDIGSADETLLVKDCVIQSDKSPAIGVGLRSGFHLTFDNCEFVSPDNTPIFFHDASAFTGDGNQYITFKNCVGKTALTGAAAVTVNSQKTVGATVHVEMINNVFINTADGTSVVSASNVDNTGGTATTVGTFCSLINFYLAFTSYGNNIAAFNYVP